MLLTINACHSLTKRKALAFVTKESWHTYIFFGSYGDRLYSDGSVGYAHYHNETGGSPPPRFCPLRLSLLKNFHRTQPVCRLNPQKI